MVVRLPSSTTPAELDQAQRLILKGKESAAFGDPKLQRIIQFLAERGFESPESTQIRQGFVEQRNLELERQAKQTAEEETVFIDGEGFSVAPDLQSGFIQQRTTPKIQEQLKTEQKQEETITQLSLSGRTPGALIESVQQDIRERDLPPVPIVSSFLNEAIGGIIEGSTTDIPIPLFGIGEFGIPKVARTDLGVIKTGLESGGAGLPGEVVSFALPTTGLGLGLTIGAFKTIKVIPPAAAIGFDVLFTPGEIKTTLDPTQSPATRIRSGIFAGLGVLSTGFEVAPFVKGGLATLGTGFRKVNVDEIVDTSRLFPSGKARVVKDIAVTGDDAFDIRLIESGKGFGFSQAEQESFIGERVSITTSARGLFGKTDDVIDITGGEGDLGLFFTPTLDAGAGEARISRLGLKSDLFNFREDAKFGFTRDRPQIVFARDVPITRTGEPGSARGLGFPSGELEVTLLPNQVLRGSKVGTTTINLQKVELFEAFVDVKPKGFTGLSKIDIHGFQPSRSASQIVSPFTSIVGTGRTRDIFGRTTPTTTFTSPKFDFTLTPPPRRRTPQPRITDIVDIPRTPRRSPTRVSPQPRITDIVDIPRTPSRPLSPPRMKDIVSLPRTPRRPLRTPRGIPRDPFIFDIDLGIKPSEERVLSQRAFQRTASLGSLIKEFTFGIKQPKLSLGAETSGLFERKFLGRVQVQPLGPIPIKKKKKKKKK